MKKSRNILGLMVSLTAGFCHSHTASAQSVDYGSLQDLFGEPITTSATGTPQRVSEAPANMTIITAEEIRRSGSRQIPDVLARIPGLDILQTGVNVYDIGVRGYQQPFQPRLLVLIDGRQVFLDDYSRTAWENIPVNIDDIRQIEVVKGASSALFGSNAGGGVINIVTYNPLYNTNNVGSLTFGTQDTLSGDATTTVRGSWGGSKFSVGGMKSGEFDTFRYDLDQPAGKPRHRYMSNYTAIRLGPMADAFTEATISDSTGNTADPTNGALMGRQDIATYSVCGGFNWQTPYGMISSNNYINHSYISLEEPTDGGAPYVYTTDLIVSQLQNQFKAGANHTFRIGLDFKHRAFKMKGAQLLEPQSPSIAQNIYAASGLWQWTVNPKWILSNAVRFGHLDMEQTGTLMPSSVTKHHDYSHSLNNVAFNSNIVFKATDFDTFRLGYGRGVQLPSLINSGYSLFQNFGTESDPYLSLWEGNPKLKPTIVQDYNIDYTRKIDAWHSIAKASLFYQLNQGIIVPLTEVGTVNIGGTDYPYGKSNNVGNSSGFGGEIQLKGAHPSGIRWDTSYSFVRVYDSNSVKDNVYYQKSTPIHHLRLGMGYTTGSWEFDASGHYASSRTLLRSPDGGGTEPPVTSGPWCALSARIGYSINDNLTLAVSGQNINQKEISTSPYPALERRGFVTLTGRF